MQKVVIITGISSGMGHAAAELFNDRGWAVYGGARREDRMADLVQEGVHTQQLDVTDAESAKSLVELALAEQGRIDVLINNAGYGEYGPVEELSIEKAKQQFDVNVFAAAQITKQVLPTMREQGFGRIVNISSLAAEMYMPLGSWYQATKASLNMWSDTLDVEVADFGIRSVVVQPSGTSTEWASVAMENARQNLQPNSPYERFVGPTENLLENIGTSRHATAEALAAVFYRAATDRRPKRRYYRSATDHAISIGSRTLPGLFRTGLRLFYRH